MTDLASNNTRVGTLETDLASNNTRVGTLETDLASNASRVGTLETDLASNNSRVGTLETDLASNNTRVGTLETDLASNNTRVGTLETDLASNNTRVGTLETDISTIQTNLSDNSSRIGTVVTDLASNASRVGTLETDLTSNASRVGTLETDLASNNTRVGTLETDLASNASRVGTLETDLTSNASRVGTLETDLASNATRVGTLETDLASNSSRVGTLETDLTSNVSRIASLETNKANLASPTFTNVVTITGNLVVTGNTTTLDTINMTVQDPIIALSNAGAGVDSGILINRSQAGNNIFTGYDHSADEYIIGPTYNGASDSVISIDSTVSFVTNVHGNVHANYFIGDGSQLTGVSTGASNLQAVTDTGNTTSNTVVFTNATTGIKVDSNIQLANTVMLSSYANATGTNTLEISTGAYVNGVIEATRFKGDGSELYAVPASNLQAVTDTGNTTSNTMVFTNSTTGIKVDSNIQLANVVIYGSHNGASNSFNIMSDAYVNGVIEATRFKGDGSELYAVPASNLQAVTDTGNTTSNTMVFTNSTTGIKVDSNIQLANTVMLSSYALATGTNTLEISTGVYASGIVESSGGFKGDGSQLTNLPSSGGASNLQSVTDLGNTTSNTVQFTNSNISLTTTSNIEISGVTLHRTAGTSASLNLVGNALSNTAMNNLYGYATDISPDATKLAVGIPGGSGQVQSYEYSSSNGWASRGNVILGSSTGDRFGAAVAMSNDGNRIVIGAPGKSSNTGEMKVFEYDTTGLSWNQVGYTVPGSASGQLVGYSVDISGDGNRIVLGVPGVDLGSGPVGVTTTYRYTPAPDPASTPTLTAIGSMITGGANAEHGTSVAMNQDGTRIVIGAPGSAISSNTNSGSISIYEASTPDSSGNVNWTFMTITVTGRSAGDRFGTSVDISGDGTRVIVGSPDLHNASSVKTGGIEVYEYGSNSWSQLGSTIYGDAAGSNVGISVSVSNASANTISFSSDTKYYVYKFDGTVWELYLEQSTGLSSGNYEQLPVKLTYDATAIAIGSPYNTSSNNVSVYTFAAPTEHILNISNNLTINGDLVTDSIQLHNSNITSTLTSSTLTIDAANKSYGTGPLLVMDQNIDQINVSNLNDGAQIIMPVVASGGAFTISNTLSNVDYQIYSQDATISDGNQGLFTITKLTDNVYVNVTPFQDLPASSGGGGGGGYTNGDLNVSGELTVAGGIKVSNVSASASMSGNVITLDGSNRTFGVSSLLDVTSNIENLVYSNLIHGAEIKLLMNAMNTFTVSSNISNVSWYTYNSDTTVSAGRRALITFSNLYGDIYADLKISYPPFQAVVATGGTVTTFGSYKIHTFTTSGTFSVTSPGDIEYLIIAGGGAGGNREEYSYYTAGGGGAGGYLESNSFTVSVSNYSIVIGAGGSASGTASTDGGNGSNTTFGSIAAIGGGGGGGNNIGTALSNGGSTGGAAMQAGTVGVPTTGQGNAGGAHNASEPKHAGGGGGAGGVGQDGDGTSAGDGGIGKYSSITGTSIGRAGGGGGGGGYYGTTDIEPPGSASEGGGAGGTSGGSGSTGTSGTSGTINTGGGGGAGPSVGASTSSSPGNGGSGVVIIRYLA